MLGSCKCMFWNRIADHLQPGPEPFSLPDPIPPWPGGTGFATSPINLGELEVCQVTKFESVWGCNMSSDGKSGVSFYKPLDIPDGYFALGHYCQCRGKPLQGFVLVARESSKKTDDSGHKPALSSPVDYTLVWSSHDGSDETFDFCGYFWLPQPPEGYTALGYLVTNNPEKPSTDEVKCVRTDLTDTCEAHRMIVNARSDSFKVPITVWTTCPLHRGMYERGVPVGTFCCSSYRRSGEEMDIACLKNLDPELQAMPNLDQIHALIRHYGPRLFFHPNEVYLPSSVSWFFENGAVLCSKTSSIAEPIDSEGSNLPTGGTNDRNYWIDLPSNSQRDNVKHGNLESSKLYVHVKPAMGGTFTDIVMWVFGPFNGPGTLKLGVMSIPLGKVGQHVGDWEHFTLRISNFTGELKSIYFSQHSGGEWIDVFDLEFFEGNKTVVYSTRNGHASFPRPGTYLQGSPRLGIGIRNDAARSKFYVDSSTQYEVVAAEYLGDGAVREPCWLQFMRQWGPNVVYDSRAEVERVIKYLPVSLRCSVENAFNKLPLELYGEEGPTGPKEKNNWIGDERG